MDVADSTTVRRLLETRGIRPAKSLGQNFLINRSIIEKIVAAAEPLEAEDVLEIGTGLGALTAPLADRARHVYSVEVSRYLMPLIRELLGDRQEISFIHQDFVHLPASDLPDSRFVVVGNLPYAVTTPILFRFLDGELQWSRMIVMVQKEVADRIRSAPASRTYGALSVAAQARARIEKITDVPAGMFYPRPKVDSTVLRLVPSDQEVPAALRPLLRAAFSQRRKKLRNALGSVFPDPESILDSERIDSTRRPETLTVAEWIRLAEKLPPNLPKGEK